MFVEAGAQVLFQLPEAAKAPAEQLVQRMRSGAVRRRRPAIFPASTPPRIWWRPTVKRFGRLDILVANHGIWPPVDAPVDQMTDAQWRKPSPSTWTACSPWSKHAVAQMKKQKNAGPAAGGHMVLISSTAGQRGEAFHVGLRRDQRRADQYGQRALDRVGSDMHLCQLRGPGLGRYRHVRTGFERSEDAGQDIFATIPLGRVGKPEEIAAPILFLCTEHAGFITGEIFNVNGGAVLVG